MTGEITQLLEDMRGGGSCAVSRLTEVAYDDLRRMAQRYVRYERPENRMQATALVHDAYLRLVADAGCRWQSRSHFLAAAARRMRQILIDNARARNAQKRGGAMARLPLEDVMVASDDRREEVLAVDE